MASPFERFPNELLVDIFEQAELFSRTSRPGDVGAHLPVRLTHVCRLWRHVAINVVTLWNHIIIGWVFPDPLFDLYIERSGTCLLDIMCDLSRHGPEGQNMFLGMLLPHVERWRSLVIIFDELWPDETGHDPIYSLSLLSEVYPPHLEILDIDVDEARTVELDVPLFANGAPQLHTVRLVEIPCLASAAFNNLTTLDLTSPGPPFNQSDLRELLVHGSHSLVSLTVHCSLRWSNVPKVELPALRVLDVSDNLVLTMISAPNLRILSLFRMTALETFINGAPHYSLEKLILVNLDLSPFDQAFHFILDHPRLESIAILSCENDDGLWNLLRNSCIREVTTRKSRFSKCGLNWSLIQSVLSDRVASGRGSISRVGISKRDRNKVPPSFVTWLSDNKTQIQLHDKPFPVFLFEGREEWCTDSFVVIGFSGGQILARSDPGFDGGRSC